MKSNYKELAYVSPRVSVHFVSMDAIICTSDPTAGFTAIEEDLPIELF